MPDIDPKTDDLRPHEWESDRPKPREPIFGPGLRWFLLVVVPQIVIVTLLVHYVIGPMMRGY